MKETCDNALGESSKKTCPKKEVLRKILLSVNVYVKLNMFFKTS